MTIVPLVVIIATSFLRSFLRNPFESFGLQERSTNNNKQLNKEKHLVIIGATVYRFKVSWFKSLRVVSVKDD